MLSYSNNKSKLKCFILCLCFISGSLSAEISDIATDLQTADDYNRKGDSYQAMYHYQVVLSKDEYNVEALLSLAGIDYARQQYKNALTRLNKILTNDAYDADALLLRGKTYSQQKKWKQALSDLEMAEQLDSENPDIQIALDNVYTSQGKTDKAKQSINNYQRLNAQVKARNKGNKNNRYKDE